MSCPTMVAISAGNMKLGKKIPNVSLIPGGDCGDVPCTGDGCYALKAWRQYKETRAAWKRNSQLARRQSDAYFNQVRGFLERKRPEWFRWHVAGDILNQGYLENMKQLAREFPETKFLCFTKRHELRFGKVPGNLAIVLSFWPGWGNLSRARKKGLPVAWMQDGTETRAPKNALQCPGSCEQCAACWNLKRIGLDVVFNKH